MAFKTGSEAVIRPRFIRLGSPELGAHINITPLKYLWLRGGLATFGRIVTSFCALGAGWAQFRHPPLDKADIPLSDGFYSVLFEEAIVQSSARLGGGVQTTSQS